MASLQTGPLSGEPGAARQHPEHTGAHGRPVVGSPAEGRPSRLEGRGQRLLRDDSGAALGARQGSSSYWYSTGSPE